MSSEIIPNTTIHANEFTAISCIRINAPVDKVWKALTDPVLIRQYMFDTTVDTDWSEGSTITWKGEWKGQPYEDKGQILSFIPDKQLRYSHFSPLAGLDDKPENYHTVNIDLKAHGSQETEVILTQDNNPDEAARKHSEENWNRMLEGLRKITEAS